MIRLTWQGQSLDIDDCESVWRITQFDPGYPEVRAVDITRPLADGMFDETRYFGPRAISLEGMFMPYADTKQQLIDQLVRFLHPSMRPMLTWQLDGREVPRQAQVRVADASMPRYPRRYQEFAVQFVAADPYWYSVDETSIQFSLVDREPGGRVYDLRFDRRYPYVEGGQGMGIAVVTGMPTPPRILIFGFCVNPRVINQTTGRQIAILGTIDSGHYLDIDFATHTITLDSDPAADRYYMLDFENSDWWLLQNGENVLRLTASEVGHAAAAHAIVSWRERTV
jgi:Phage tail protein